MKCLLFLTISTLFISCQSSQIDVNSEIKPVIRKNWDQFINAWEKEDAASCASFYTENGINIPPAMPVNEGRNAVESFYKFLFESNISSRYTHKILELSGSEQSLIEYGQFTVEWVRNDSTEWTYHARTMAQWVKENDSWKIDKFIFNNPPETE